LRGSGKLWMLMLVVLISLLSIAQTPRAQAATATPSLGDKALSFLTDVIQLDLSKYKVTLYENTSNGEHLFYRLYPNDASPLFSASSDTLAIFNFHNGTLGSCDLSPGLRGLIYVHPFSDRFNATLGIVQRFETWANDSWATGMENLMAKVGSEKNVLEVSGNESLRITLYSSGFGIYQFSNYFEGVEYTGVTIAMGNSTGDLFFTDSRAFHKIGNTTINVSREQAINIAEDYVKNYSYKHTFGNGTSITVSNLNVTGISSAGLKSDIGENSMLFPYWDVRVNVSNMPARGLQGVGVVISANDGTVKSAYQFTSISIGPLISLILFPTYQLLLTILAILIAVAIGIIIILVVILRKTKEKPPSKN
jgi:hypothetical protein